MTVNADDVKAAMRLWASGVTVVTTADGERRAGTTASSFTSVSMNPPLILVCLYNEAAITKQIQQNGHFAVSILSEPHSDMSSQMAGYIDVPEGEDRFYGYDWETKATGSLVFADASAWLDCKLHAVHDGSTHRILVGEVVAVGRQAEDAAPLVFFNRGYQQISRQEEAV